METNPNETAADWIARLFETEYCDECGGDVEHHQVRSFLGNPFALCLFPPGDDGSLHPTVAAFRQANL